VHSWNMLKYYLLTSGSLKCFQDSICFISRELADMLQRMEEPVCFGNDQRLINSWKISSFIKIISYEKNNIYYVSPVDSGHGVAVMFQQQH
jgi:hypothetical protein